MVNLIFSTSSTTNCCSSCCCCYNEMDNINHRSSRQRRRGQVGNKQCNTIKYHASQCQYIEQLPTRPTPTPTQLGQQTKQLLFAALLVVLITLSQLATCQQQNHRHDDLRSRIHNNNHQNNNNNNNNRPSNLSQGSSANINGQQQPQLSTRQLQQVQRSAPVILSKNEEFNLVAGSNVTLACSARGVPAPTFVWFQDNKNITGTTYSGGNNNNNGTTSDQPNSPPPSTDLLEERRYIIEQDTSSSDISTSYLLLFDLKLTDTSVFLCWVENEAGYAIGNFSLIINEPSSLAEPQISAIGSQVIVFILLAILLTATIVCLLVLKITGNRSSSASSSTSSTSSSSDMKKGAVGGDVSTPTKDMPSDEGHDGHSSYTMADSELGFMKQLRSGIINIENHSMSPALQFNTQVMSKHMNNNYHHTNNNTNNMISMNHSAQDRHSKIRQQEQWDSRQHDYLVGESDADEDLQSQTDSAMTTQMLQMPQMQPILHHNNNNNPYMFQQQQHQQHIPPYHMAPTHVGHLQHQQQQQQQHQHQHMQQIPQMPQVSQIPPTLHHQPRLLQSSHEQLQQQQQQQDPFAKYMMLTKKPEAVSQMPQSFI